MPCGRKQTWVVMVHGARVYLRAVPCNQLTTWVVLKSSTVRQIYTYNLSCILCKWSTQVAYIVLSELCAWFTQYNSRCKLVACDSFRQKLCSVNLPYCKKIKLIQIVLFGLHSYGLHSIPMVYIPFPIWQLNLEFSSRLL